MAGIDTRLAADDLGDIKGDIRLEVEEILGLGGREGLAVYTRDGSILGDGDNSDPMITAGLIGALKAGVDIGDGDFEDIIAT